MKACYRCKGPNTTMAGLCVACQVWFATQKAMASHEAEQRRRPAVPIRRDLYRDPRTIATSHSDDEDTRASREATPTTPDGR